VLPRTRQRPESDDVRAPSVQVSLHVPSALRFSVTLAVAVPMYGAWSSDAVPRHSPAGEAATLAAS